jgi:tRNA dimethylallyltransferase
MSNTSKPRIVVIVGATATGKTSVSVELAQALNGEIVNGDSRLFYEGMDVATAKPTPDEIHGVPHHLIDFLAPDDEFSLGGYLTQARSVIKEIIERGKLPIIVGGSGQYIWALVEGWEVPEIEPDLELRTRLEHMLTERGVEALANELREIAPETAADTDLLNPRRITRAIERILSKKPLESTRTKAEESPFDAHIIGLSAERSVLHERVTNRLDRMLANGWEHEVRSLLNSGYSIDNRAMSGIGYRQMIGHINGEYDLDEGVRLTAVATNRLIRQQSNWFKQKDPRINWFDMTQDAESATKSVIETVSTWLEGT